MADSGKKDDGGHNGPASTGAIFMAPKREAQNWVQKYVPATSEEAVKLAEAFSAAKATSQRVRRMG